MLSTILVYVSLFLQVAAAVIAMKDFFCFLFAILACLSGQNSMLPGF